jgi:glycosyltransferase involved in cell wall biosynthesis
MIIGIDASNIRRGGGVTHLIELLRFADPSAQGFSKVVLWSGQTTLNQVPDRSWLIKEHLPVLDSSILRRSLWQKYQLSNQARLHHCDVLFVPGGSYAGNFRPTVAMSQNLLPFEWKELARYAWSLMKLRLLLLRLTQSHTFTSADGVIFLTHYAKSTVEKVTGLLPNTVIIPHGINQRFLMSPRPQKPIESYTTDQPFRLLYVSIIDQYKHQWHLVDAIARLRRQTGWHLALDLVGPAYPPALRRLKTCLEQHDPQKNWVHYRGAIPFDQLHGIYQQANLGIFASSCENMPNILLETMATGLPVACSNCGPMPEMLGDAGVYFDPENPQDIATAVKRLVASPDLRTQLAAVSFASVHQYTWERCAKETFAFLADMHRQYNQENMTCAP